MFHFSWNFIQASYGKLGRCSNRFLGYFQPQQGKPALWELDSDQHHHVQVRPHGYANENAR